MWLKPALLTGAACFRQQDLLKAPIDNARVTALVRSISSLSRKLRIIALLQSYNRIELRMSIDELQGRSFKQSGATAAFREELKGNREDDVQTDWSGMDYLTKPFGPDEDCG